jgi:hypothetical protein
LPFFCSHGISVPAVAEGAANLSLKNRGEMAEQILPEISVARRPASVEPVVMTVATILGLSALEAVGMDYRI